MRFHSRRQDRDSSNGFTLLEVMIALAILASAIVVLLRITLSDVRSTHKAKMLTIATELARSKMYDIESELLKDGFQDTDQEVKGDFSDEGQPTFTFDALIEKITLPSVDSMTQSASSQPANAAGTPGIPTPAPATDPANSALLDPSAGMGTSMVAMYLPLIEPVLENSIRRVTLTVMWKVGSEPLHLDVICFFTDTKAITNAVPQAQN